MALAPCVKWVGWLLNLQGAPRATLPEDKTMCIVNGLLVVVRSYEGAMCVAGTSSLWWGCFPGSLAESGGSSHGWQ